MAELGHVFVSTVDAVSAVVSAQAGVSITAVDHATHLTTLASATTDANGTAVLTVSPARVFCIKIGADPVAANNHEYGKGMQPRTRDLVLAASDAPLLSKAYADVVLSGTADNVAIQAQLDTLTGGGKALFTPGSYNLAASIVPGFSKISLEGVPGATVMHLSGAATVAFATLTADALTDISIEGFEIDGDSANVAGGIALYSVTRGYVKNCYVHDIANALATGGYGYYFDNCLDLWVEDCVADTIAQRDGFQLKSGIDCYLVRCVSKTTTLRGFDCHDSALGGHPTRIYMIDCIAYAASEAGFFIAGDDVLIENPIALNCGNAGYAAIHLASDSGDQISRRISVTNPHVIDPNANAEGIAIGVYGWQMYGVEITGGMVDMTNSAGSASGVMIQAVTSAGTDATAQIFDLQIEGLLIRNATQYGIFIRNTRGAGGSANFWTRIRNVTARNCGSHGFFFDNAATVTEVEIDHVLAENNTGYGIYESATADGNRILWPHLVNNTAGTLFVGSLGTTIIRSDSGFLTENQGTGTIANGATSAVITHGLGLTPTLKHLSVVLGENPTADPGIIWIDTITATQFTVNCRADPGASGLDFAWKAERVGG